ncbi:MAG: hypothetical protein SFV51_13000 [Bryobacteraceae bacterium]|nr:hypothetical protein [Bryobacteraceae bacterium]
MKPDIWKEALRDESGCPPVDRWRAWVDGVLPAAERNQLEQHQLICPRCEAEVAMLREFVYADASAEEARQVEWITSRLRSEAKALNPAARISWWQWLGTPPALRMWACAAVLLVVAGAALEWRRRAPELEGGPAGNFRSVRPVALLSEVGDLPQPPAQLRWQAVEGASHYLVRLFEVDQRMVWEGRSHGPELAMPAEALKLFVPRKTLLVQVQALDVTNRPMAESEKIRIRVQP